MPLYDLGCVACDCIIRDISISVREYEKMICPKCAHPMKSVSFPKSFQLLGDGWTPELTGSFRYRERAEIEYEVNVAHRDNTLKRIREYERNKKIYIT